MYVKTQMTGNPYTIRVDATIPEAVQLMHEKKLKRLPVVDGFNHIKGIITEGDIQKVSPTKATSLSIFEINYLLSKTLVKNAMTKDVLTISPNALLEEAAVMMRDRRIGALVVTDDEEKVVGIITESNIFDAFIELLGFRETGTRIALQVNDVPGVMAEVAEVFAAHQINITHIADFRGSFGVSELILRTNALDTDAIEAELTRRGYQIDNVLKTQN